MKFIKQHRWVAASAVAVLGLGLGGSAALAGTYRSAGNQAAQSCPSGGSYSNYSGSYSWRDYINRYFGGGSGSCPGGSGSCPGGSGSCPGGSGSCPGGSGSCPGGDSGSGSCPGGSCPTESRQPSPTDLPELPDQRDPEPAPTPTSTPEPRPTTTPAPDPKPTDTPDPGTGGMNDFSKQIFDLTNAERTKAGLAPFKSSSCLNDGAQQWSDRMASTRNFNHNSLGWIMSRCGHRMGAENIAMGYRTPEAMVRGWMNSSGHRANILNPGLTHMGVGFSSNGNYGTQNFGG